MKEQFKTFLSQLSETNATLDYFVDFEKVIGNVSTFFMRLCKHKGRTEKPIKE